MNPDPNVLDYIYIDKQRIQTLIDQVILPKRATSRKSKKWSLSTTGPKIELAQDDDAIDPSDHTKIQLFIEILRARERLMETRPQEMPLKRGFVLERTRARKIVLPNSDVQAATNLRGLAVWIADPDPAQFSSERYIWRGTFLYLTQLWLDEKADFQMYSGRSALLALINLWNGRGLLANGEANGEAFEPLGRGNFDHPIEKLRSRGALVGDEREILTLYMPRYMSDEQCYRFDGNERRVNDLLAYPIFIAQEL
jgi:hypothetical protein